MFKIILTNLNRYKKYVVISMFFITIQSYMFVKIPYIMSKIIDDGILMKNYENIFRYSFYLILIVFFTTFVGILNSISLTRSYCGLMKNLRESLFVKIQKFSSKDLYEFENSKIITRLTKDIQWIGGTFNSLVKGVTTLTLQSIFSIIVIKQINSELSILFLFVIPVLIVIMIIIFKLALKYLKKYFKLIENFNNLITETISNMRIIKTFNAQNYQNKKFKKVIDESYKVDLILNSIFMLDYSFLIYFLGIVTVIVLYFGGNKVVLKEIQIGSLIATITYSTNIISNLFDLLYSFFNIFRARESINRIKQVLDRKEDIIENTNPIKKLNNFDIEFKNVSFSYEKDLVLKDINFNIKQGESVGIIGSIGSGKSTLVNLLVRLYDVKNGNIFIGGEDIRNISLDYLKENITLILQKSLLFKGSIRFNMKLASPNISDEEIYEVLEGVKARDFIKDIDFNVEQQGNNLSGGQKQRLYIARAILKKSKVIIFDDSLSAIDTRTDKKIREYLKEIGDNVTKIYIGQRILTIKDCDKIIVIDDGEIKDIGTHNELLKRNEIYNEIYISQQGGDFNE